MDAERFFKVHSLQALARRVDGSFFSRVLYVSRRCVSIKILTVQQVFVPQPTSIEHVDTWDPTVVFSLPGIHLRFARRWASGIVFSRSAAWFSFSPLNMFDLKPSLNGLRIIAQHQPFARQSSRSTIRPSLKVCGSSDEGM